MPPRRNRVNNEANHAFTAAVAQAVLDLLLTFSARITDEIRQNENNRNNGNRRNARRGNPKGLSNDGDAQSTNIHLDGETSTEFMKRFHRLAGFLGAKAGTQEEQTKNFKWGLNDFILDRIVNTEFTDVVHVANIARNTEIMRDMSGQDGNNKRNRDGHRIRSSELPTHGSNQRTYERRDNDRYGNSDRHGNNDRHARHGNKDRCDKHGNDDRRDRHGKACHRAAGTKGSVFALTIC
nr:zinc finger, CCHC-type, retrotransposon Gag domain protein [Tanacetum cinerariifolium]